MTLIDKLTSHRRFSLSCHNQTRDVSPHPKLEKDLNNPKYIKSHPISEPSLTCFEKSRKIDKDASCFAGTRGVEVTWH